MTYDAISDVDKLMFAALTLNSAAGLIRDGGHCPHLGARPVDGMHSVYSALMAVTDDDQAYTADTMARLAGVLLVQLGSSLPAAFVPGPAAIVEAWEDTRPGTATVTRLLGKTADMFNDMAGERART